MPFYVSYILMGLTFVEIISFWMKRQKLMKAKGNVSFLEMVAYGMTWPIFPFVVIMFILYKMSGNNK